MVSAQHIVDRLLEAGEPDQDYDHEMWDAVVNGLEEAGISGARHREFDKYAGVYLFVPHIGKFWVRDVEYMGDLTTLELTPDAVPADADEGSITVGFDTGTLPIKADVTELVAYCTKVINDKRLAASMRNFVDTSLEKPKRSVRPKPKADLGAPNYGGGMMAAAPQDG